MSTKIFNVSLPVELIEYVNRHAMLNYTSRNEYIKQAIITRLKEENAFDRILHPQTPEQLRQMKLQKFLDNYRPEDCTEDLEWEE